MGVSKDTARSAEDQISTPLPGETLAVFYARSSTCLIFRVEFWLTLVYQGSIGHNKRISRVATAEKKCVETDFLLRKNDTV